MRSRLKLSVEGPITMECNAGQQCPEDTFCDFGRCNEKCHSIGGRRGDLIAHSYWGWCWYNAEEIMQLFGELEVQRRLPFQPRTSLSVESPSKLGCNGDRIPCPTGTWCDFGVCSEVCWGTPERQGKFVARKNGWCQYNLEEILALFGEKELEEHGAHWPSLPHMDNDSPIRAIVKSSNRHPAPQENFQENEYQSSWEFDAPLLDQFGNFRLGTYITDDWVSCDDSAKCWKRHCNPFTSLYCGQQFDCVVLAGEPGTYAQQVSWFQCPDGSVCTGAAHEDCKLC